MQLTSPKSSKLNAIEDPLLFQISFSSDLFSFSPFLFFSFLFNQSAIDDDYQFSSGLTSKKIKINVSINGPIPM